MNISFNFFANVKNNLILVLYKKFWLKTFDFKTKSTNKEYWLSMLINLFIILIFLTIGDVLIRFRFFIVAKLIVNLFYVFLFSSFLPFIALQIRRINMVEKSWKWLLINIIPVLGNIFFVLLVSRPEKSKK
tara:strand:- start:56 stop:448 length:393 start_codon:yes stop_codon:yes gene_type:complete